MTNIKFVDLSKYRSSLSHYVVVNRMLRVAIIAFLPIIFLFVLLRALFLMGLPILVLLIAYWFWQSEFLSQKIRKGVLKGTLFLLSVWILFSPVFLIFLFPLLGYYFWRSHFLGQWVGSCVLIVAIFCLLVGWPVFNLILNDSGAKNFDLNLFYSIISVYVGLLITGYVAHGCLQSVSQVGKNIFWFQRKKRSEKNLLHKLLGIPPKLIAFRKTTFYGITLLVISFVFELFGIVGILGLAPLIRDIGEFLTQELSAIHFILANFLLLVPFIIAPPAIRVARRLRKRALSKMALSATELLSRDGRKPVLYLRPFEDDSITLVGQKMTVYEKFFDRGAQYEYLEYLLVNTLSIEGPVVAIGDPNDPNPPAGASRDYLLDESWKLRVHELMEDASIIVMCVSYTEGVFWEIDEILNNDYAHKTIFVIPPEISQQREVSVPIVEKILPEERDQTANHIWEEIQKNDGYLLGLRKRSNDIIAYYSESRATRDYDAMINLDGAISDEANWGNLDPIYEAVH